MTRTWKTLLLTLAITLTAAPVQGAQLRPSSDLLLPWFEVDLDPSGITTLFAVGNASDKPVEVLATLRTNWGIAILEVPLTLQPDEIRTVNLRDWLSDSGSASKSLTASPELAHAAAAASGQPSPKDRMYYASEVQPGRAVGSVTLRTQGGRLDALWGDWFTVDAGGGVARGDVLVDIDRSGVHSALCRRHLLRYLSGGGFDGSTELIVWRNIGSDTAGQPSESPDGAVVRLSAEAAALSEPGRAVETRRIELMALDRVTVAELGLEESFGALRIETADDVFIGVRHSAANRYSVELEAYCVPATPCADRKGAMRADLSLDGQVAEGPRGPLVDSGSTLDWTLVITNTGPVPVSGIEIQGLDATCPAGALAAGESMSCKAKDTALSNPQTVSVAVTGRTACAEVFAFDSASYEGVLVDVFP